MARWFELDSDSCWTFVFAKLSYKNARERCENKYLGKLLEVDDENVPEVLKNGYDSDLVNPSWISNKVL